MGIARIPQIEQLNASQISEKERLEAERRYVSTVSREILKATSNLSLGKENVGVSERGGRNDGDGDINISSNENNAENILNVEEEGESSASKEQNLIYKKYPRFEELVVKHKDTMMA